VKKLSIEITEETHLELLKVQLDKRMKEGVKKPLAQVAADVLEDCLVTKKAAK
jgi:hypothetical protein